MILTSLDPTDRVDGIAVVGAVGEGVAVGEGMRVAVEMEMGGTVRVDQDPTDRPRRRYPRPRKRTPTPLLRKIWSMPMICPKSWPA